MFGITIYLDNIDQKLIKRFIYFLSQPKSQISSHLVVAASASMQLSAGIADQFLKAKHARRTD